MLIYFKKWSSLFLRGSSFLLQFATEFVINIHSTALIQLVVTFHWIFRSQCSRLTYCAFVFSRLCVRIDYAFTLFHLLISLPEKRLQKLLAFFWALVSSGSSGAEHCGMVGIRCGNYVKNLESFKRFAKHVRSCAHELHLLFSAWQKFLTAAHMLPKILK